jgi:hypothetical protein
MMLADVKHPSAKKRRDRNFDAGRCINENKAGTHGLATHGCRCQRCDETHARSA